MRCSRPLARIHVCVAAAPQARGRTRARHGPTNNKRIKREESAARGGGWILGRVGGCVPVREVRPRVRARQPTAAEVKSGGKSFRSAGIMKRVSARPLPLQIRTPPGTQGRVQCRGKLAPQPRTSSRRQHWPLARTRGPGGEAPRCVPGGAAPEGPGGPYAKAPRRRSGLKTPSSSSRAGRSGHWNPRDAFRAGKPRAHAAIGPAFAAPAGAHTNAPQHKRSSG